MEEDMNSLILIQLMQAQGAGDEVSAVCGLFFWFVAFVVVFLALGFILSQVNK